VNSRPVTALPVPPGPVAVAAVLSALLVGMLLGASPQLGFGLMVALIYGPLVLINLRLGIVLYVVLVFIQYLEFVSVGPTAASILILVGWLGSWRERAEWTKRVVTRRMLVIGVMFVGWLTLSALWAGDAGEVGAEVWYWYIAALTSLVIMTTFSSRRSIEMLVIAFVVGAVVSVLIGGVMTGFNPESAVGAGASEGRLTGGSGDPNYLAAGIVPAIVLAIGLFSTVRSPLRRWPLLAAIAILAIGLAASESRGGMVAAIVALAAACVFFKERRAQVVVLLGVAGSMLALWFTISPDALERVRELEGGSGRSELWSIAWHMTVDHPVVGVGLNNYRLESRDYVRQPGNLESVRLIVETPRLVHNMYLQLSAETGVVGLLLFLALAFGSMGAARRAAINFDIKGERGLATLSRSVLVATIGTLSAAFFLSNGTDTRQWVLLGLGPALLALSRQPTAEMER
jgi:O-antigen ligase